VKVQTWCYKRFARLGVAVSGDTSDIRK